MMNRKLGRLSQSVAGACYGLAVAVLAVCALFSSSALAQGASTAARSEVKTTAPSAARGPAAASRSAEEESAQTRQRPGGEGVKVHGHWTVEVKNPDGSLVKHIEFENSLVGSGAGDMILAQLLSGEMVVADWAIVPNYQSGTPLCNTSTNPCDIVTTTTGAFGSSVCAGGINVCTPGLTLSYVPYNASTSTGAGIQLQGSIVAAEGGSLVNVATRVAYCTASTASSSYLSTTPSQCLASTQNSLPTGDNLLVSYFTSTTLGTSVAFVSGQTVTFTVSISFS
jgi:hypothetical protein